MSGPFTPLPAAGGLSHVFISPSNWLFPGAVAVRMRAYPPDVGVGGRVSLSFPGSPAACLPWKTAARAASAIWCLRAFAQTVPCRGGRSPCCSCLKRPLLPVFQVSAGVNTSGMTPAPRHISPSLFYCLTLLCLFTGVL